MEEYLELPISLIEKSSGFALDIGASNGKLIYRPNKEFKNGKLITDTGNVMGNVYVKLFPRDDIDAVVDFIKSECDMTWKKGDEPIKTTGCGGNSFQRQLEQKLDVKLHNLDEFDCMVNGLMILYKQPGDDLFVPLSEKAIQQGRIEAQIVQTVQHNTPNSRMKRTSPETLGSCDDLCNMPAQIEYPCMLVTCGSHCVICKIEQNGKLEELTVQMLGGKFFQGISTLLLGKKPFEELMNEVLSANGETCDTTFLEYLSQTHSSLGDLQELLSQVDKTTSIRHSAMGKVLNSPKEAVNKADAAFSVLKTVCELISRSVVHTARIHELNRAYFVGNFVTIPKVRDLITKEICRRKALGEISGSLTFQFLKFGGHLGSLGAFTTKH